MAIVSQESARLWVARLNTQTHKLIPNSGAVYRFPGKHYRNVEGIDWLSEHVDRRIGSHRRRGSAGDELPALIRASTCSASRRRFATSDEGSRDRWLSRLDDLDGGAGAVAVRIVIVRRTIRGRGMRCAHDRERDAANFFGNRCVRQRALANSVGRA